VDVEPENQQTAGDHLQFVDDKFITNVIEYFLVAPVRKRMRRGGDDFQAFIAAPDLKLCTQLRDVLPRFVDVGADAGADFIID
jgi:hypothetical protein